jgi:thymidylate synthase (FAD)
MKKVEIRIYRLAQPQIDPDQLQQWLEDLGASEEFISETINADISESTKLIGVAAKRCYMSFEPGLNPNVTQVRKNWVYYIDNILKSRHGSVLEHASQTFAIEGVSRVFTGEMNRHRAGVAISEGSMRFIRFEDIPYWEPLSIRLTDLEKKELEAWRTPWKKEEPSVYFHWTKEMLEYSKNPEDHIKFREKKLASQRVFERAFTQDEENYKELQRIWDEELAPLSKFKAKKEITSMMRRVIGMGVATGGVWTLNMRALRHVIAIRASEQAEEEICHVFSRVATMMVENEPLLLKDFGPSPGKFEHNEFWKPIYEKV